MLSNCYIEGSTDFIWGFSAAFIHQSFIATNAAGGCITAQGRDSQDDQGGFVIDASKVNFTTSYEKESEGSAMQINGDAPGSTYLGRPYTKYSRAVYTTSFLDKHIDPAGWKIWSKSDHRTGHVSFGEYHNEGPGSWSSNRAPFATELTKDEAEKYTLRNWIGDISWLDEKAYDYVPSYSLTGVGDSTSPDPDTSNDSDYDGTKPPPGAYLVSQKDVGGEKTYDSIQEALNDLPGSSDVPSTVFIYPGTYMESITIHSAKSVKLVGYSESPSDCSKNQVTIRQTPGNTQKREQPSYGHGVYCEWKCASI